MKKEECIAKYGLKEYKRRLEVGRVYRKTHKEQVYKWFKEWYKNNPAAIKRRDQEKYRKGGKYYKHHLEYHTTGIPGEKHRIRGIHAQKWRKYKNIIAPSSQVHHQWLNDGTAGYTGVALVEANQHRYGIIEVIEIIDGEITLFTEKELREQKI